MIIKNRLVLFTLFDLAAKKMWGKLKLSVKNFRQWKFFRYYQVEIHDFGFIRVKLDGFFRFVYDFVLPENCETLEIIEKMENTTFFDLYKEECLRKKTLENYGKQETLIFRGEDFFKNQIKVEVEFKKFFNNYYGKKGDLGLGIKKNIFVKDGIGTLLKKNSPLLFICSKIITFPRNFYLYATHGFRSISFFTNFSLFVFITINPSSNNSIKIGFSTDKAFIIKQCSVFTVLFFLNIFLKNTSNIFIEIKKFWYFLVEFLKKPVVYFWSILQHQKKKKIYLNIQNQKKLCVYLKFFAKLKLYMAILKNYLSFITINSSQFCDFLTSAFSFYIFNVYFLFKKKKKNLKFSELRMPFTRDINKIVRTIGLAEKFRNLFLENFEIIKIQLFLKNLFKKKSNRNIELNFNKFTLERKKNFFILKRFVRAVFSNSKSYLEVIIKNEKKKKKTEIGIKIDELYIGSYFLIYVVKSNGLKFDFWIYLSSLWQIIDFSWGNRKKKLQKFEPIILPYVGNEIPMIRVKLSSFLEISKFFIIAKKNKFVKLIISFFSFSNMIEQGDILNVSKKIISRVEKQQFFFSILKCLIEEEELFWKRRTLKIFKKEKMFSKSKLLEVFLFSTMHSVVEEKKDCFLKKSIEFKKEFLKKIF